jgi:hypothetical protein
MNLTDKNISSKKSIDSKLSKDSHKSALKSKNKGVKI